MMEKMSVRIVKATLLGGCFLTMLFSLSACGSLLEDPPKPEITYGEFPFELIYEVNGTKKSVQDTLICEFDGIGMNEGVLKYRKWKGHLASGNSEIVIWEGKNREAININRVSEIAKTQKVFFDPGESAYYMGDIDYYDKDVEYPNFENKFPIIFYYEKFEDGEFYTGILEEDELLERFEIKLISWEHAPPIENTFK